MTLLASDRCHGYCWEGDMDCPSESRQGFLCMKTAGHTGSHVACGLPVYNTQDGHNYARWPNEPAS